jgi:hypothetical protein
MSKTTSELAKPATAMKTTPVNADQARVLTDKIKRSASHLGVLLIEARERNAPEALGYKTWYEYVENEFKFTRQRAQELMGWAKAVAALSEAASTDVDVSDIEFRAIKPVLPAVVESVKNDIVDLKTTGHEVTREQRLHVVKGAVAKVLGERIERKKSDAEAKLKTVMDGLHYFTQLPEPQRSEYFARVFTWLERNVPELMAEADKSLESERP